MGARNTSVNPQYIYNCEIDVDKNGGISLDEPLNLGRCGDKEVCKLVFHIGQIKEYNEEYNVYCVFKDQFDNKTTCEVIISEDKTKGVLVLPEQVTEQDGQYEMILVFQEAKSNEIVDSPNVSGTREYFISSVFKGWVSPSA